MIYRNSSSPFSWTHEYLLKVLSTGKDPIVKDPLILNAFRAIDRAYFVPDERKAEAYRDKGIDIGFEQELTSPVVIARMLTALEPRLGGKYLELGTGSGYLAALLGFLVGKNGSVYTMERLQWLWQRARENIGKVKKDTNNVSVLYRDGMAGLPDKAPFEGIIVSFAIDEVPDVLLQQLLPGGKIIYPGKDLNIYVGEKGIDNELTSEIIDTAMFKDSGSGVA